MWSNSPSYVRAKYLFKPAGCVDAERRGVLAFPMVFTAAEAAPGVMTGGRGTGCIPDTVR